MRAYVAYLGVLMVLLFFTPGACGIGIGGGTDVGIDGSSQAQGVVVANEAGAISTATSTGRVTLGQPMYVEDSTGKHAEVMLDVVNGTILSYRARFSPRQGNVPASESVSAKQTVSVKDADKITAQAKAWNAAGDLASVDIQVGRVGPYGARFKGETDSSATAGSAVANADGDLKGSLLELAMAGPLLDQARDSTGDIVDCDLLTRAVSAGSRKSISGRGTFNVDDDWGGKIQAAVNASADGDLIRVAPGTYRENVRIDKSLTVRGSGAGSTTVDGSSARQVFVTGAEDHNASIVLSGMNITNGWSSDGYFFPLGTNGAGISNSGTLYVDDCRITRNRGVLTMGAGIYNDGVLTVKNSEISNNGIAEGIGGGICNFGTASVVNTRVLRNFAGRGGGIYNHGILDVAGSRISDNAFGSMEGSGGGISNEGDGIAAIRDSEISGNTGGTAGGAGSGDGIFNSGTLRVVRSRIYGNYVDEDILFNDTGLGAGIFNIGSADVVDSTISGNRAWFGGGIYNRGTLNVTGSRIIRNTALTNGGGILNNNGTVSLVRTTVRLNTPNDIVGIP